MGNLDLWNKVALTNPDATKRVNQRGGFTAIDAYSQIEKATEIFGPVGVGWGWSVSDPILPNNDTVAFKISLWHGNKDQVVEQFGQAALTAGSRADNDAFKKAVTDGLTKCLSYLGFNADVFLGKFDDSKYVQHARHMAKQNEPSSEAKNVKAQLEQKPNPILETLCAQLLQAQTFDALVSNKNAIKESSEFAGLSGDDKKQFVAKFQELYIQHQPQAQAAE